MECIRSYVMYTLMTIFYCKGMVKEMEFLVNDVVFTVTPRKDLAVVGMMNVRLCNEVSILSSVQAVKVQQTYIAGNRLTKTTDNMQVLRNNEWFDLIFATACESTGIHERRYAIHMPDDSIVYIRFIGDDSFSISKRTNGNEYLLYEYATK